MRCSACKFAEIHLNLPHYNIKRTFMIAAAVRPETTNPTILLPAKNPKTVSWEVFQRKYLNREDAFKYEWVDGQVEKTKSTMDPRQFFIQDNLTKLFNRLFFDGKVTGQLIAEGDMFFANNHRRPDMAYLEAAQIALMAQGGQTTPQFVVEIISSNDQINLLHKKMRDYRNAGVQVVWHILPELEEVHVFTGKLLKKSQVCMGTDICSAAPVLLDFTLPAADIFTIAV